MGLVQTVAPAIEPVTLQEMKDHLRETSTAQDGVITSLITAARQYIEQVDCKCSMITQKWKLSFDRFPEELYVRLPYAAPLASVETVQFTDGNGVLTLWDPSNYIVDEWSQPGLIHTAWAIYWPLGRFQVNGIQIDYTTGYGATADKVPEGLKAGIKLLVGHWYENREAVVVASGVTNPVPLPLAIDAVLAPFRVVEFP